MTIEEKAKAYDEALEHFKAFKEKYYTKDTYFGDVIFDKTGEMQKDFESIFPELRESEDERIRKEIIEFIQWSEDRGTTRHDFHQAKRPAEWISYLEKQKELPFVKDVMLGYPGLYFYDGERMHFQGNPAMEEKQKEPHFTKRDALFDKCVENCDPEVMKRVSDEIDAMLEKEQKDYRKLYEDISKSEWFKKAYEGKSLGCDYESKEQKPNIELIQKSWYMEGYHDREFNKEPKWVIKTGEGGPKYEENPKYGQMLEAEQKPSCGNVNVESEFDKGWRAGHKAGLKDAEQQKPAECKEYSSPDCGTTACCVCDYSQFEIISAAKKDIIEKTNIAENKLSMELPLLDGILTRVWQVGWLNKKPAEWSEEDGQ